ncbi:Crossover junction endonuclease mus81 [Cadophora gregata]|uniref:Crossover junction endonuclease mus81 n=1 Tax=Cadophora gregata TaxID=51156 RepID=UPI0026DD482C|nr:Crossover junction endonuclease mus81 [Cadophora gregata]KAK0104821.1 Crossover junction endonuclease mus81 [Cadophora gregata]KAK0115096.1 Crossover junction endonuclease mus81 [Cadophora gregata f. sp. sojae]
MADCANQLWYTFAFEWLTQARHRNSRGAQTYKKACDSLKACPFEMQHPSEVIQLTGWGPKLVDRLTKDLQAYCDANMLPMPKRQTKRKKKTADATGEEAGSDEEPATPKKKARKTKPYVPGLRTGPYALLIALATQERGSKEGISKSHLIELAQPHCDASFSAPSDPTKFYTAWNSMKTLQAKDMVYEKGRPTRLYYLTDEGWDAADALLKTVDLSQGRLDKFTVATRAAPDGSDDEDGSDADSPVCRSNARPSSESPKKSNVPDIVPLGRSVASAADLPTFTPIVLEPGFFSVELVLDIREIRAKSDRDYMQKNLTSAGVKPIMRAMSLGDVLWVAKLHDPGLLKRRGAEGDEVLLDYVVERKRLDDLIGSIKDGRFHEQKFRLRKSGIKNVIYIIEEMAHAADRYEEAVASAIASTQVVNGYFVKKTQKMDDTIRYLVSMTKILKDKYETKPLNLIPTKNITTTNYLPLLEDLSKKQPGTDYHITYDAFADISSKSGNSTLRDVYLKMLMCIRGVTGEKALEIQKRWKTPVDFLDAYNRIEEREGQGEQCRKKKMDLVSSEMSNLIGRKKMGKALSVKISEVWGDVQT